MYSYYFQGSPYWQSLHDTLHSGLCICTNDRHPDRISFPMYVNIHRLFLNSNALAAAGLSGGTPVAVANGSVGDLFSEGDRASAMALYSLGPLIGT